VLKRIYAADLIDRGPLAVLPVTVLAFSVIGLLHLVLLGLNVARVGEGPVYQVALGLELGLLGSAAAGVGIARGYVFISWATVQSLSNYLRPGVPVTWEAAVGTR
jgi:hypothetical protein